MFKVAVLMSTYNGEKYLREQIDSILKQKDIDLTLFIRDDGSSDKTIETVKEYLDRSDRIKLSVGKNVGVGNSFMDLVYNVPTDYDFYAFSDQDDVWLPEKLTKAANQIKDFSGPALYCSNQILVDKELKPIGMRYSQAPDTSYLQIMCGNKFSGCTMVWNRSLLALLKDENKKPSEAVLKYRIHDTWVVMVCAVTGNVLYDDESYIYYRQHENNVVGVRKTNYLKKFVKKLKDLNSLKGLSLLCRDIYEKFRDDITSKDIKEQLAVCAYYTDNRAYKKKMLTDKTLMSYAKESRIEYVVRVLSNLM